MINLESSKSIEYSFLQISFLKFKNDLERISILIKELQNVKFTALENQLSSIRERELLELVSDLLIIKSNIQDIEKQTSNLLGEVDDN